MELGNGNGGGGFVAYSVVTAGSREAAFIGLSAL